MASYLRPSRGSYSKLVEQDIILKNGEILFEYPEEGPGTGYGKIKMGDGKTRYSSLPYFSEPFDINGRDVRITFTDTNTPTDIDLNRGYLSDINPYTNIPTIFTNLKQLLVNYNSEIVELYESVLPDIERINELLENHGERIDELENKVYDLTTRMNSIEGRMTTAEGKITSLESRMTTAESNITNLTTRMTTAEGKINTNTSNISSLTTRITTAEGNISGLTTKMNTVEDSIYNETYGLQRRVSNLEVKNWTRIGYMDYSESRKVFKINTDYKMLAFGQRYNYQSATRMYIEMIPITLALYATYIDIFDYNTAATNPYPITISIEEETDSIYDLTVMINNEMDLYIFATK